MKKTLFIIFISALLVGLTAFGVAAAGRGKIMISEKFGPGGLDLTIEQQQKILSLKQTFQKDTANLHFDLQKKNLELRQLWEAKTLDLNAINAKTNEINALKVQLIPKQRDLMEKIKAVLTPEQQKQLNNKDFRFGHPMGMGGMGPDGPGFIDEFGI